MFTGLVRHVGELVEIERRGNAARLVIAAPALAAELASGDSVAVDGACLTVTGLDEGAFAVDAVPTTLGRTTLGGLEPGRRLNLERAVRAEEPLGGHIVQGHVDGVGEVVEVLEGGAAVGTGAESGASGAEGGTEEGAGRTLRIRLPEGVAEYTVERGSLTVDGVSLTVAGLSDGVAKLAIIPYTLGHTNLGRLGAGSRVNLEADVVAKYVARLLHPYRAAEAE